MAGQVRTHLLVDGTMRVELRGELDAVANTALSDQLSAEVLSTRPAGIVVDLDRFTVTDGTGPSALIGLRRAADTIGAPLRVINTSPSVARLLRTAESLERQPVAA